MRAGLILTCAAVLPMLAGCVIIDSQGGEKVTIRNTDSNVMRADNLETVSKVEFDGQKLSVVVGSNGCTDISSFEVRITDTETPELSLVRRAPDMCRAIVPQGVALSWTYAELGLKTGQAVKVLNPLSL